MMIDRARSSLPGVKSPRIASPIVRSDGPVTRSIGKAANPATAIRRRRKILRLTSRRYPAATDSASPVSLLPLVWGGARSIVPLRTGLIPQRRPLPSAEGHGEDPLIQLLEGRFRIEVLEEFGMDPLREHLDSQDIDRRVVEVVPESVGPSSLDCSQSSDPRPLDHLRQGLARNLFLYPRTYPDPDLIRRAPCPAIDDGVVRAELLSLQGPHCSWEDTRPDIRTPCELAIVTEVPLPRRAATGPIASRVHLHIDLRPLDHLAGKTVCDLLHPRLVEGDELFGSLLHPEDLAEDPDTRDRIGEWLITEIDEDDGDPCRLQEPDRL